MIQPFPKHRSVSARIRRSPQQPADSDAPGILRRQLDGEHQLLGYCQSRHTISALRSDLQIHSRGLCATLCKPFRSTPPLESDCGEAATLSKARTIRIRQPRPRRRPTVGSGIGSPSSRIPWRCISIAPWISRSTSSRFQPRRRNRAIRHISAETGGPFSISTYTSCFDHFGLRAAGEFG